MAAAHQFALPDVGEGLTEAEIVSWLVEVGDVVAVNDLLVEVETAKSLVELPSPYSGTIATLHAAEGDTVDVGSVIVTFWESEAGPRNEDVGEEVPSPSSVGAAAGREPEPRTASVATNVDETRQPVLVGYGPTKSKVERRARKPEYRPPLALADQCGHSGRPYATPPVRLRARELGIDLGVVTPSGSYGQVTHADLDTVERRSVAADTAPVTETRTPIKGVRRATAAAMVKSAFTAPHVTEWVTVDLTETLELLEDLRSDRRFAGVRLTPLVLISRAALSALAAHPAMNAKWDDDAGEIVQYRDVNLGIATATPRGLMVPNIKAAQNLSTHEMCCALDELVTGARSGKTQPEAMSKGTFTITNIGVFGVDGGTPILNPGEAGILCVGQIVRRPWEYRGEVALRSVCTLSLSFDHRVVDGQLGSQVLSHIARLLAHPAFALAS